MAKVSLPEPAELPAAVALLARLVAYPTISAASNRALIDDVAAWLRGYGVPSVVVEAEEEGKAGLIASIGPAEAGGIVLSGHTDVVPVEGQRWSADPFTLVERGGRLHGRGSADMKGFVAAALALVPRLLAKPLRRPVHLALSWDEEVGCRGAPRLIETLLERVPRPAIVIVGEPTGMRPADSHRGIATFTTTIEGRGGHASAPQRGVSAITLAARFIRELERMSSEQTAAPAGNVAAQTTVNVGRISGGAATNMIADACRLEWECRTPDESNVETLLAHLDSFAAQQLVGPVAARAPEVAVTSRCDVLVPPFAAGQGSPAVALALQLTGANACDAAPFATEAGLFERAGIPAVVLGPGWPSEAHRPDEFVSREQLSLCLHMLRQIAEWAA